MNEKYVPTNLFPSLAEARQWVLDTRDQGVQCPCCDRLAKLYRRVLNSGMTRALVEVYWQQRGGADWIDVARQLNPAITFNHEWPRLRHWDLITIKPGPQTKGRAHNLYHVTDLGISFVENRARVPRRVYIYDNVKIGQDERTINITESLGEDFDYVKLMQETPEHALDKVARAAVTESHELR